MASRGGGTITSLSYSDTKSYEKRRLPLIIDSLEGQKYGEGRSELG